MARNVYLKMKSLDEARAIVRERLVPLQSLAAETIPVPEAVGRVLAEPVFAVISAPNYHAAAMDGVAVKAETTYGASESQPRDAFGRAAGLLRQHRQRPARWHRRGDHDRKRPGHRRAARRHRGAGLPLAARAPGRRGHRRHRVALRPPPPDHALLRGGAA